jgi:SNF2 family DNA or RNA helicase
MPLSVLSSWRNDLEKFLRSDSSGRNQVDVLVHHGERVEREAAFGNWTRRTRKGRNGAEGGHRLSLVLTTYEVAMKDVALLRRGQWQYMVVSLVHTMTPLSFCKTLSNRWTRRID